MVRVKEFDELTQICFILSSQSSNQVLVSQILFATLSEFFDNFCFRLATFTTFQDFPKILEILCTSCPTHIDNLFGKSVTTTT